MRRASSDRRESAAAALAVGVKQFVAAYGFDALGRARHEVIDGPRIFLTPQILEIRPKRKSLAPRVDLDSAGTGEFLLAEDEVAESEQAAFVAFDGHAPLHGRFVARNGCQDRHDAFAQPIDPATIAEAHLEGRRHGQQPPSALRLHEHAQSTGAGDIVGIARDGKELVEGRVADGELCAEHAVHPAGRGQNGRVGQHLVAAAQNGAVAARHDALLVAQDDMAAIGPSRTEKRQQLSVDAFHMRAPAVARSDRFLVEAVGDGGWRIVQQAMGRRG